MQVVGPITLAAGPLPLQTDPAVHTPANQSVQIQNYSGFQLTGSIGGNPFAIPAFTAATIPFKGNGQLVWSAVSTLSATQGTATLVWLLKGDINPTKDGPLTALITATTALTVSGAGPYTVSGLNAGMVSMTVTWGRAASSTSTFNLIGNQSNAVVGTVTIQGGTGNINTTINLSLGATDTSVSIQLVTGAYTGITIQAAAGQT